MQKDVGYREGIKVKEQFAFLNLINIASHCYKKTLTSDPERRHTQNYLFHTSIVIAVKITNG